MKFPNASHVKARSPPSYAETRAFFNLSLKLQRGILTGMGTDFEKKKPSNLCDDMAYFTSPPPYLGQDCMQLRVIDICPFRIMHWPPKKIRKGGKIHKIPIPVLMCRSNNSKFILFSYKIVLTAFSSVLSVYRKLF